MSSRFSTSQSRAQHTPKVCISKTAEAARVVVPTYERAVVTLDLHSPIGCPPTPIYQTFWMTRSAPDQPFMQEFQWPNEITANVTIQYPLDFTPSDFVAAVSWLPIGGGGCFHSFNAPCPRDAWSHTLYGGRSTLTDGFSRPVGIVSIRFDGQAQTIT